MATDKKNLLLLFERPNEPVWLKKGKQDAVFDVPDNFLVNRYQPISTEVQNKVGADVGQRIPVRATRIPDLSVPMELGRKDNFTLFIPRHRKIAAKLIDIFMNAQSVDELQSIAIYARDRVNSLLFNYALSVALLHRPDTKDLELPLLFEAFPDKYVDSKVLGQIREEMTVVKPEDRVAIIIPKDYTASDLEPEHRLWYFREDMGINLHHWHWHLVFPFEAEDRSIVDKDRRGELFFYMHQQIQARYNLERFSNNLARVKRLTNFREIIPEGYYAKMDSLLASRAYPPRAPNSTPKDVNRELDQLRVDIADMERWLNRIFEAIHQGFIVDTAGNRIPLDETRGVDILGNIMESSILSPNRQLYGDWHNMGHVILSYVHDPDHRYLESFSAIGAPPTAMRDPLFYRFHEAVDDIFQEHKQLLPAYTLPQLNYPDIIVNNIDVNPDGGSANNLNTFWQRSDVNLTRGMDFVPRGDVFVRITHLQHTPFEYVINVTNNSSNERFGTARIFLGPKNDERGSEMLFRDQRILMIELDKFLVQLRPGQNTLRRRSVESSVTIPFERTFRNLDGSGPADGTAAEQAFNFCGCGWPQHMLIPKGTEGGLRCELFVMISNYDDDRVDQDLVGTCNKPISYCGVQDRLYPDKRPMGYPFDRLPRTGTDRLNNFLTPNMFVKDVTITHRNMTVDRQP